MIDLSTLKPEVQEKARAIIADCKKEGFDLLIYSGYRSLEEQAILYRQSRTIVEINQKIDWLNEKGFKLFAKVLSDCGPQFGRWVTNAAPGESWHNFREAFDAVPVINDKAIWNYEACPDHWDFYNEIVQLNGMTSGRYFGDRPHAQLRKNPNPLLILTNDEINNFQ